MIRTFDILDSSMNIYELQSLQENVIININSIEILFSLVTKANISLTD